eukprot:Clim_evm2s22 gene=Clim_evmTU2s22
MVAIAEAQIQTSAALDLPYPISPVWQPLDDDPSGGSFCHIISTTYWTARARFWSNCNPSDACMSNQPTNEEMCQIHTNGTADVHLDHQGLWVNVCTDAENEQYCQDIVKDLTGLLQELSECKLKNRYIQGKFYSFQIHSNNNSTATVIDQLWYTDYAAFAETNKPNCSPDVCPADQFFIPCTQALEESIATMAQVASPQLGDDQTYVMTETSGAWIKRFGVENTVAYGNGYAGFGVTLTPSKPNHN